MFAWQPGVLRTEIARHLPALHHVLERVAAAATPDEQQSLLRELFPKAPLISFDYGVLEKSERVYVIPAYFGWDDVGTWAAISRMRPRDPAGNSVRGRVLLHDAEDIVVEATDHRLIGAVGVSDLVIVDTDEATLVCHKGRAHEVREIARQARDLQRTRPTFPPEPATAHCVDKPWGRELWWAVTDHSVGKLLEVRAGHSLSLQYHEQKHETMFFQTGSGQLLLGETWHEVGPGSVFTIAPGTVHQLVATTDLTLMEVSTPHLQDVVRLADRYGRTDLSPREAKDPR